MSTLRAVVTGASSGIGRATAKALAAEGFTVVCAARRAERIASLAEEIGGVAVTCDVTDDADVRRLVEVVGSRCDLLVNNAVGALGQKQVSEAEIDAWQRMYEVNVLGAARVTRELLPALVASAGTVLFVTSTAAEAAYEGGAGYCGVKSAERALAGSLRLELFDQPVRVCEISPGMVHTPEFSLTRFGGDQDRADAVYAGVPDPLVAEDIADAICWMATRPAHVNVDRLVIRPRAQAANHKVFRVNR